MFHSVIWQRPTERRPRPQEGGPRRRPSACLGYPLASVCPLPWARGSPGPGTSPRSPLGAPCLAQGQSSSEETAGDAQGTLSEREAAPDLPEMVRAPQRGFKAGPPTPTGREAAEQCGKGQGPVPLTLTHLALSPCYRILEKLLNFDEPKFCDLLGGGNHPALRVISRVNWPHQSS